MNESFYRDVALQQELMEQHNKNKKKRWLELINYTVFYQTIIKFLNITAKIFKYNSKTNQWFSSSP